MSAQEVDVTITPQQAAHGVILTVTLPTGPARLRIPSGTRDGELVRVRAGGGEVPVRVRVSAPAAPAPAGPTPARPEPRTTPLPAVTPTPRPAPPGGGNPFATPTQPSAARPGGGDPYATAPAPPRTARGGRPAAGCLVAAGICAAVLTGIFAFGSGDGADGKASGSASPTWSASPEPSDSSDSPSYSPAPAPAPPTYSAPAEVPEPTQEAAPTPYDRGTCLNGTLPDSTTAQRVDDVEEVPCSAADAHYRVIGSIPMTSDMDRCDDYPKTQYAFSHRYTLNGSVINEYVYCLVGLGSYARD
ncbi:hypothetical protein ACFWUZ_27890 [Streptomyces sp. NPDC058646]|uniref:LppU/SCO3897 family protein n=1 Tax=Streptomyces sp. NPDC058646 TaxID=3346574 RepID=UPI003661B1FC